ncbi:MAG: hypothetical protein IJF49_02705 [Clostridia bacterium]|nr:hypothetical protein [Clostridia bacterium]
MSTIHTERRRALFILFLLTFGLHALRSFVICPLKVVAGTDVAYMATAWPIVLDVLADLLQMAVVYIAFSFVLRYIFAGGLRAAMPFALIYIAAFIFGTVGNFLMDMLQWNMGEYYQLLLLPVISGILQELLQLVIVIFAALLVTRRSTAPIAVPERLFSFSNPVQRAALIAVAVTAVFRLTARIIFDVDAGMPTSGAELAEMVGGYASDLLIPLLGYLGMVLWMMHEPKQKTESSAQT